MPLLDHFHTPLTPRMPWTSVGSSWAVKIMDQLNETLPRNRYQALTNAHLGNMVEADLAEFEHPGDWSNAAGQNGTGGAATLTVPEAVVTVEADIAAELSVYVQDIQDGMTLVAAVEFISPANKDRRSERDRFLAKCLAYLDRGVGVIVIDIVTSRHANLHNELIDTLLAPAPARMADVPTYVAAYRPHEGTGRRFINMWPYPALLGSPLPAAPLALKGGPTIMLDLETPYTMTLAGHGYRPAA